MNLLRATIALALFIAINSSADPVRKFRISLDTAPNHLRNITVTQYIKLLEKRLGDKWHIEVFPSGQLYKDRDVPKALYWRNIEMGLVSVTGLARYEANIGLFISPPLYGFSREQSYQLFSSKVGAKLIGRLESKLDAHVLGEALDLGFLHTFFTQTTPIDSSSLIGKKIRVPGAAIQMERFKLQGANPIAIPWSDVPLALAQNGIDGLMSSYETVRSGKLWDSGITQVYEDRGVFVQYIPLVRQSLWETLSTEEKEIFTDTWSEVAHDARQYAATRQDEAKQELASRGITFFKPSDSALREQRKKMGVSLQRLSNVYDLDPNLIQELLDFARDIDAEPKNR